MENLDDALIHCKSWGRQTISFALSVRAERDGASIDDESQVKHVVSATDEITKQLWQQATAEERPSIQVPHAFARLVFEWVSDHLSNT